MARVEDVSNCLNVTAPPLLPRSLTRVRVASLLRSLQSTRGLPQLSQPQSSHHTLPSILYSSGLPCFTSGVPDGLFHLFPELLSSPFLGLFVCLLLPASASALPRAFLGPRGFYSCSSVSECWQGGDHSRQAGPRCPKILLPALGPLGAEPLVGVGWAGALCPA